MSHEADVDRFIRESECRAITGLSRATRWRMEREEKFPKRKQISKNGVAWLLSEVTTWMRRSPVIAVVVVRYRTTAMDLT